MNNPFRVISPENLQASEVVANLVDVHTDLPKLTDSSNLFVHGPRGTGKSFMLRSLEPEVRRELNQSSEIDLPFFAIHVPIKRAFFGNPEFINLKGWQATTIGEHCLALYALSCLFESLGQLEKPLPEDVANVISAKWYTSGGDKDECPKGTAVQIGDFFSDQLQLTRRYCIDALWSETTKPPSGALIGFLDYVVPVAKATIASGLTHDKPICLMVDDADNLQLSMQKVLNSWVSSRTTNTICFKITTQLAYRTWKTVDGRLIEEPHDFSDVNVSSMYTSDSDAYAKRVREIVRKRLNLAGIAIEPDSFFPEDQKQKAMKEKISGELRSGDRSIYVQLSTNGPSRPQDWVDRYTIPALMRSLNFTKSSNTFSYAGLQSMIDLSSGVVRWFLDPAAEMFNEQMSKQGVVPDFIEVKTQNKVVDAWSKKFRQAIQTEQSNQEPEIDLLNSSLHATCHDSDSYNQLANLIDGLGGLCREKLLDATASEQRVFSFALTKRPSGQLSSILDLGVRLGYLQKADLASKSYLGMRTPRFILSRRLGPHYRLDVSGYAAHMSVTVEDLEVALHDPKKFIKNRLGKSGSLENADLFGGVEQ